MSDSERGTPIESDDEDLNLTDDEDDAESGSSAVGALHQLGEQIKWAEEGMSNLSTQWDSTVSATVNAMVPTVNAMVKWTTESTGEPTVEQAERAQMELEDEKTNAEAEDTRSSFFFYAWDSHAEETEGEETDKEDGGATTDGGFDDEVNLLNLPKRLSALLGWDESGADTSATESCAESGVESCATSAAATPDSVSTPMSTVSSSAADDEAAGDDDDGAMAEAQMEWAQAQTRRRSSNRSAASSAAEDAYLLEDSGSETGGDGSWMAWLSLGTGAAPAPCFPETPKVKKGD